MPGEAFLESYGGQSTEELLALAGDYRIDSLVLAFEQALQQKQRPFRSKSHMSSPSKPLSGK